MTWSRTLALVSAPLWGRNLPPVSQDSGRWLRTSNCLPPPLTFPWTTPPPLQMELVELQCNDELKAKFYNSSPLAFSRHIALPSRNVPKYIAHVKHLVAMFGDTYSTVANSSSPKWSTRSIAFDPFSRTAISLTFFCCGAHPSSRTFKYFFMASSTSRLTDLPALQ